MGPKSDERERERERRWETDWVTRERERCQWDLRMKREDGVSVKSTEPCPNVFVYWTIFFFNIMVRYIDISSKRLTSPILYHKKQRKKYPYRQVGLAYTPFKQRFLNWKKFQIFYNLYVIYINKKVFFFFFFSFSFMYKFFFSLFLSFSFSLHVYHSLNAIWVCFSLNSIIFFSS